MPDREFIHSTADVTSTLLYAFDSGLLVRLDESQAEPRPCMLTRDDIADIKQGVFFLYRPEWVFGQFQIGAIPSGYYAGKFSVSPGVNCSPITVSFHGERMDHERRRFGGCIVSWDRDWLEKPAKILRPSPPEVQMWWKRIVAHLSSKVVIKAGVHKYIVCKGVLADPEAAQCLPPFDFIPWGKEVLS